MKDSLVSAAASLALVAKRHEEDGDHGKAAEAHSNVADVLATAGPHDEAIEEHVKAISLHEKKR